MKLVAGLGNPGSKYEATRHNVGFRVVDRLASQNRVAVKKKLCDALVGEYSGPAEPIVLAQPRTFMNRSGESVKKLLAEFRAEPRDLIVVYDELDLPFGRIRIRPRGSAGGHRGVLSIMEALAGAPFCRVRVGIGRPPEGMDPADYVLQPFNADEAAELDGIITRASDAVTSLIQDGPERAMEKFNRAS